MEGLCYCMVREVVDKGSGSFFLLCEDTERESEFDGMM